MKIAHVCTSASNVIMKSYIRFVYDVFDSKQHDFIIVGKTDDDKHMSLEKNNSILKFQSFYKDYFAIVKILKKYDKIILHSLVIPTIIQPLFFANRKLVSKIFWIAWGYDLYEWKKLNNRLESKLKNYINFQTRQKIKYFVGIFPPDINYFKKVFKTEAKTFYASYTGNLYNSLYNKKMTVKNLKEKVQENDCINILVGHSSRDRLNHFEVLNSLKKYEKENIKIYIPLSYGDMSYGDEVQRKAKNLFGDKVICLREMVTKDKYMELLTTIDIAIFNTTRQFGLGNINPLLFMEKKIYMPKNSVMYDYYRSKQIDIWDCIEINDLDYREFVQPLRFKGGRKYISENELNWNRKIDMWEKVFTASLK